MHCPLIKHSAFTYANRILILFQCLVILICYTVKPESSLGLKNLKEAKEFSKSKEKAEFSPKSKHKQLSCKYLWLLTDLSKVREFCASYI